MTDIYTQHPEINNIVIPGQFCGYGVFSFMLECDKRHGISHEEMPLSTNHFGAIYCDHSKHIAIGDANNLF